MCTHASRRMRMRRTVPACGSLLQNNKEERLPPSWVKRCSHAWHAARLHVRVFALAGNHPCAWCMAACMAFMHGWGKVNSGMAPIPRALCQVACVGSMPCKTPSRNSHRDQHKPAWYDHLAPLILSPQTPPPPCLALSFTPLSCQTTKLAR